MKTPNYWKYKSVKAELLLPFAVIYFIVMRLKYALRLWKEKTHISSVPIICVGNATAGGAGKTPTAIALCNILKKEGKSVAIVSKGYKGKFKGTLRVDPDKHDAALVGDEPRILAKYADCYVCKKRADGVKEAIKDGAQIIIFDDGLHDPTVRKDISLLVIDGSYGFGNGYILPSGPLRDKIETTLEKSDFALLLGSDTHNIQDDLPPELPVQHAKILPATTHDTSRTYIAFAGIGLPEKFFLHLQGIGLTLIESIAYPDHYEYSNRQIEQLLDHAIAANAQLITTEKDLSRIDPKYYHDIAVHKIDLVFSDEDALLSTLKTHHIV